MRRKTRDEEFWKADELDNTTGQTEKTATHRPRALSHGNLLWGRNTEPRSFDGPRRLPCKAKASGKCQSLVSAKAMIRCATPAGKSTPSQWMSGVLVASCPVRHRPRQCGHAALESVRCHVDMWIVCWHGVDAKAPQSWWRFPEMCWDAVREAVSRRRESGTWNLARLRADHEVFWQGVKVIIHTSNRHMTTALLEAKPWTCVAIMAIPISNKK